MLYIWLKNAEEQLGALNGFIKDSRIAGKKYVLVNEDICDPTAEIPDIPVNLIEKVTLREIIFTGLRTEGVYRLNGAEMVIRTTPLNGEYNGYCQSIHASAPSVESLKKIYTLVRQGKLDPGENWEENTPIITTAPAAPAVETEKATD